MLSSIRLRVAGFGAALIVAGFGLVFSTAQKSGGGIEAVASVLSRSETCDVKERISRSKVDEGLSCKEAKRMTFGRKRKLAVEHVLEFELRYVDAAGQTHEVVAATDVVPASAKPGETITVVYDPADPEVLRRRDSVFKMAIGLLMAVVGVALAGFGLGINPVALLGPAAASGVKLSRSGTGRVEPASQWTASVDQAIARELEPAARAAVTPSYSPPLERTFGRRAAAR